MYDPDSVEQINKEIAVIAAHIARLRDLIEDMRAEGKATAASESALEALSGLYRQRLQVRQKLARPRSRSTLDPAKLPRG